MGAIISLLGGVEPHVWTTADYVTLALIVVAGTALTLLALHIRERIASKRYR